MNTNTKRLMQGTIAISTIFLGVCMLIYFYLPSSPAAGLTTVSDFSSYSTLLPASINDDYLNESGFKNDYSADFGTEEDNGLALYRQSQSRPAVEWFYTHVTGSREIATAILENADKNDIPVSLAFSLAYVESNYRTNAVNRNSNYTIDRGLFQLNSASFPKLTEADFFDPRISAKYGMIHLRYCMDVAGNEITALAMYNAGTTRVKNNNTPQHTLNYVAKIQNYRGKLETMFANEVLAFYDNANTTAIALAKSSSTYKN